MTTRRRALSFGRSPLIVLCAALVAAGAGCGKKQQQPKPAPGAGQAGAPSGAPTAAPAPAPELKGISVAIEKLGRDTAERAAASLRKLGDTSTNPADFGPWLDPSQSALAVKFVGPSLMYFGRVAALRRAAEERFGTAGADEVLEGAAFLQIQLDNGLRELFDAVRVEEVRRAGPNAYVMSNNAAGEPMGDALCFRENQGEWLLLLARGDTPWPESRIANLSGLLGGPLERMPKIVSALDDATRRLRAGEFKTSSEAAGVVRTSISGK